MGAGKANEKAGGGGTRGDQRPDVGQWARLGVRAVVLRNKTDRKTDSWPAQSLEE